MMALVGTSTYTERNGFSFVKTKITICIQKTAPRTTSSQGGDLQRPCIAMYLLPNGPSFTSDARLIGPATPPLDVSQHQTSKEAVKPSPLVALSRDFNTSLTVHYPPPPYLVASHSWISPRLFAVQQSKPTLHKPLAIRPPPPPHPL